MFGGSIHGSEWRREYSRQTLIIEPYDGYVFGYPFAGILKGHERANRRFVIPGEDSIEWYAICQQLRHRSLRHPPGEVTRYDQSRVKKEPMHFQSFSIADFTPVAILVISR